MCYIRDALPKVLFCSLRWITGCGCRHTPRFYPQAINVQRSNSLVSDQFSDKDVRLQAQRSKLHHQVVAVISRHHINPSSVVLPSIKWLPSLQKRQFFHKWSLPSSSFRAYTERARFILVGLPEIPPLLDSVQWKLPARRDLLLHTQDVLPQPKMSFWPQILTGSSCSRPQ